MRELIRNPRLFPFSTLHAQLSIVFILLTLPIFALSPYDSWSLHRAQSAARSGVWRAALAAYRRIDAIDDRIRYNEAGLLYRLGRYREAAALYRRIEAPDLQHARLHNLGNCLVRLGDLRQAAALYRAALKFADDADTRANLALVDARLKAESARTTRRGKNRTDLRPGSTEGVSDWQRAERIDAVPLREAKITDRQSRANLAHSRPSGKGRIERSDRDIAKEESNRTVAPGERDSVALRHWRRVMERGSMRTLLLPIETEGERDVPKPW